jgi:hypothetical protein
MPERTQDTQPTITHPNGLVFRVIPADSYTARMSRDIHQLVMSDGQLWNTGQPIGWHGTPAAWRTENTHLTQQDEALRQAHDHDRRAHRTRAGLQWIAQRLDTFRRDDVMTDNAYQQAARRYVIDTYTDDLVANGVMNDLPLHARRAGPGCCPTGS